MRIILILFLLLPVQMYGQQFFRISADFSIKEKRSDGTSSLTKGRLYYDLSYQKLVYEISFPEKMTIIIDHKSTHTIVAGEKVSEKPSPGILQFSIFHLSLSGNLMDYGLKNSFYEVGDVEREGDMVITTWKPTKEKDKMGDIIMANQRKRLYGLVFQTHEGEIMSKQFFTEYQNIAGLEFPHEITQITYLTEGEQYQITSFKNILVNERANDSKYNFPVTP